MLWRQNSITHSSQTPSSSGSLAIRIRIDARAAAGQCPQQMQSSSLTPESLTVLQPLAEPVPLGRDLALQVNRAYASYELSA